jgi:hypothetical protein
MALSEWEIADDVAVDYYYYYHHYADDADVAMIYAVIFHGDNISLSKEKKG